MSIFTEPHEPEFMPRDIVYREVVANMLDYAKKRRKRRNKHVAITCALLFLNGVGIGISWELRDVVLLAVGVGCSASLSFLLGKLCSKRI